LGRKKKAAYEYRLRWDDVRYEPGELKVVAYKNGKRWAEEVVKTTGSAAQLLIDADRKAISANGKDLAYVTVRVADINGRVVPDAANTVTFSVEGPGEIVATDNGDPASLVSFASKEREAYSGLVLAIVRSIKGKPGLIKIKASSPGLNASDAEVRSR
jgi:beta-galactosidase